jgi:hypothetical protein
METLELIGEGEDLFDVQLDITNYSQTVHTIQVID